MTAAAWRWVAGSRGFAARAIGRGARDWEPHHRRDGVGLLTLGVAIVLGASLWGRMGNAAGRGIRTVAIGGFGSLAWIIPVLAGVLASRVPRPPGPHPPAPPAALRRAAPLPRARRLVHIAPGPPPPPHRPPPPP